jgi:acetyl esterase/lipase
MKKFLILFLFVLTSYTLLTAQEKIIKIWPGKIPGSIENPVVKEDTVKLENGQIRISKVVEPTITLFFPQKERAVGAAVVICPGGGYGRLAIDHEGFFVAKWLNELGIVGVVLKYRLPNDAIMINKSVGPLQDVQEAIRIVRRNSKDWNINPNKIGVMGSSAGGHLASTVSTHFNEKIYDSDSTNARPDFAILLYPVISMNKEITHSGSRTNLLGENPDERLVEHFSNELQVRSDTPPTFLVHAADDKTVPVQNSINYFSSLKKYSVLSELHIFEKGGHGFGLAKNRDTESQWPQMCEQWLKLHGIINTKN